MVVLQSLFALDNCLILFQSVPTHVDMHLYSRAWKLLDLYTQIKTRQHN